MNSEITKFKKKVNLEAIIRSLLLGLAIGFLSCGVPVLYFKLNKYTVNVLPFILGMVGVTLVVFGITYLITKPSELKVAKRIDRELGLKEKVTTMVVYKNNQEPMYKVQREDTKEILSKISIKSLSFKVSIFLIVICVLSLSVMVTSVCYPNYVEPEVPEQPVTNTDYQNAVIKQLIRDIKADEGLVTTSKTAYINYLVTLDSNIKGVMVTSKRNTFVKEAIALSKEHATSVMYSDDFSRFIGGLEMDGENEEVNAFITSMKEGFALETSDLNLILSKVSQLREKMEESRDICKDMIKFLRISFVSKIKNADNIDKENAIVKQFITLSDSLTDASQTLSNDNYKGIIGEIFDVALAGITATYFEESRIAYWAKEIEYRLSVAFLGMTTKEDLDFNLPSTTPTEDGESSSEDQVLNGEYKRPSDMEVYSSILGQYEKYYESLGTYREIIREQYRNGEISDEINNIFEKYFSALLENNGGN